MTYQEFRYDSASRHRYWARSFVGWRHMGAAEPNPAHHCLAAWQQSGVLSGLVTQNVDGLHDQAAAALSMRTSDDQPNHAQQAMSRVVALHGNLDQVTCLTCGGIEDRRALDLRLEDANPGYAEAAMVAAENVNPDGDVTLDQSWVQEFTLVGCQTCGADTLKPDVVYFGESVPEERKAAVDELVAQSSALLVVGSSMAVMSGFSIALKMHRANKPIAVVNGGPSRADAKADFRWRTRIAPALEELSRTL